MEDPAWRSIFRHAATAPRGRGEGGTGVQGRLKWTMQILTDFTFTTDYISKGKIDVFCDSLYFQKNQNLYL
jgi:hypothetical protein